MATGTHSPNVASAASQEKVTRGGILLIEDDETLASLLARVLRGEGYHVELLDNADDLPPAAKLARFDVVLSDIHLANGTNGNDVLKRSARRSMGCRSS